MLPGFLRQLWNPRALSGALLILLFGSVAFTLACHDLQDNDVWWHLRAGEWILQNGRAPDLDPFSFPSRDRPWVDHSWLFQLVLLLTYRCGSVAGIILLAAAVAATAVLVALAGRPRGAPLAVVLLGWLPALLLAADRFVVRPETVSLLFLAATLAIVVRLDERPRLAWLLPLLQLLWVNAHGLFVFGPIVLGFWLVDRAGRLLWQRLQGHPALTPGQARWWRHVGGASAAVVLACFLNPYGANGALFPFVELYPKVTEIGNPYKAYIEEFRTPREFVRAVSLAVAGNKGSFCCFPFLLLLVPLGFLLPALWKTSQAPSQTDGKTAGSSGAPLSAPAWLGILAASITLLAVNSLTLTAEGRPRWLVALSQATPALLALTGTAGGLFFLSRNLRAAAGLAAAGGIALAAWAVWLRDTLFGSGAADRGWPVSLRVALPVGAIAVMLILRHGGSLFRILLAAAFASLALKATNSLGRFGLVAGFLLSWELAPWVGRLLAERPARPPRAWAGWSARLGLAGLLLAWVAALLTQHTGTWLSAYPFGLRERPLTFAHQAARFAGQPDMPRRALVYDLVQACVYVFHSAPENKVFMDARLEVPSLKTFRTYVALESMLRNRDPRAIEAIRSLGDPVVLLPHEGQANGEALLLTQPGWRLVYFDALAAVFLPPAAPGLEARFPTLDLAARHFVQPDAPSQPLDPGAASREAQALYALGEALRVPGSAQWSLRVPVLLAALDRAELTRREEPTEAAGWTLLALCHWRLLPELRGRPASTTGGWDPETGLGWAQTTYCFHRAAELAPPDDLFPLVVLYRLFAERDMADAQRTVAGRLLALGKLPPAVADEIRRLPRLPGPVREDVASLLSAGRAEQAARLAERLLAEKGSEWDWDVAERLAGACMHLGRPALARQVWLRAKAPPSDAVLQARLADTFWVERDFDAAVRHYRRARRLNPRLAEPCWALAWLHAQQGQAAAALRACRDALALPLSGPLRSELQSLEKLLLSGKG